MSKHTSQNDKEPKIDPMWSADEHERRLAIIRRAAAGARKALRDQASLAA
ncbi:hypothetical protein N8A98_00475 (plasmid) [Devosia neptuniae]|uniref:Uncharacterized protein n=1 Tax=Devosia neptuniae TaxID=191302 RepID=A0ABY6C9S5_9HYPH|nr:hypothetical protein [Devosia neptuniae]UXN68031.1 hypothetical protein N8A98_00475 [Devosia neptuniae]